MTGHPAVLASPVPDPAAWGEFPGHAAMPKKLALSFFVEILCKLTAYWVYNAPVPLSI